MYFDSHAHLGEDCFTQDFVHIVENMRTAGVSGMMEIGFDGPSSYHAVELANRYDWIWAAVGSHPDDAAQVDEARIEEYRALCEDPRVKAIGEIGLDYYWDNEPREVQKKWFIRQLELARELDLPVLIHSREAAADTMEIMKEHAKGLSGVIHCYSYSKEMAQEYIKMGFYIGVGGVVTFKNAKKLKEVVENIPLTSIVLETDCPYMAPEPNRGKRNNSAYIRYVAEKIAELKGITYEEVVEQTEKNAREMYRL